MFQYPFSRCNDMTTQHDIFPEDVCDGETIHCPGGEDEDPGIGCPPVRCKADPQVVTVSVFANTSSKGACRACHDLDG